MMMVVVLVTGLYGRLLRRPHHVNFTTDDLPEVLILEHVTVTILELSAARDVRVLEV